MHPVPLGQTTPGSEQTSEGVGDPEAAAQPVALHPMESGWSDPKPTLAQQLLGVRHCPFGSSGAAKGAPPAEQGT
jgi:hypothetical protein